MLVIVEHGDVHFLFQALFNDETFRRFDVLKVDPAKGRPHQFHRAAKFVGILGVQFDIDGIHIRKPFEQNRFPLHHGFAAQRA